MTLFDRNIEPSCTYCKRGVEMGRGEVACVKRGIVAASGFCRSFRYEPIKRTPYREQRLDVSGLSEEDFTL